MGAFYFAQDGIPNIETEVTLLEFSGVSVVSSYAMTLPAPVGSGGSSGHGCDLQ